MRKRKQVANDLVEVRRAMDETKDVREFRILQCVWLADTRPELSAQEIGEIAGFKTHRVKVIHSNFRKIGMDAVKDKRGGRYREYMSPDEEALFLAPFEEKSQAGTLAVAGEVKSAYEEKVGKKVAESTIYRLLNRHGFRKIVPYKRHKKADLKAQEAFKKTLPLS
jgi:transposase